MLSVTQIGAISLHSKKWSIAISEYKPSDDALCNLCLRSFNFTIVFHDNKKDENKVIRNARIHVNSAL